MGEVRCFTMKGQSTAFIGEFIDSEDDFHYVVRHPVAVMMMQPKSSSDGSAVTLVPFLQFTDEFETGITMNRGDLATLTTPVLELRNQYSTIFGSGIVLAT